MHPDEEALIARFVAPHRRQRMLGLLASPKGRQKRVGQLYHFSDLDPRFAHRIPPRDHHPDSIYKLLRSKGAPAICHVMSTNSELDGRDVDLREVLEQIVGWGDGTFLSCLRGRLGYFENEETNGRYILERPPHRPG